MSYKRVLAHLQVGLRSNGLGPCLTYAGLWLKCLGPCLTYVRLRSKGLGPRLTYTGLRPKGLNLSIAAFRSHLINSPSSYHWI